MSGGGDALHVSGEQRESALPYSSAAPPRSAAEDGRGPFAEILHDLSNTLVSILLNAQILEWKLPSYSRLRRNVHEVERSAQRGGVLVNRLRNWERNDAGTAPDRCEIPPETMHANVPMGQNCSEGGAARDEPPVETGGPIPER